MIWYCHASKTLNLWPLTLSVILSFPGVKLDCGAWVLFALLLPSDEPLWPGPRLPLDSSRSCIQQFFNLLPFPSVVPQGRALRPNNNMPHLRKEVFVDYTRGFTFPRSGPVLLCWGSVQCESLLDGDAAFERLIYMLFFFLGKVIGCCSFTWKRMGSERILIHISVVL